MSSQSVITYANVVVKKSIVLDELKESTSKVELDKKVDTVVKKRMVGWNDDFDSGYKPFGEPSTYYNW